jgi:hypothetical protein
MATRGLNHSVSRSSMQVTKTAQTIPISKNTPITLSTSSTHNTNVITAYSQTAVSQIGCCDGSNNYNTRDCYFEHSIFKARPTLLTILALRIMSKVLIKTYNCQKKYKIFMLYIEPTWGRTCRIIYLWSVWKVITHRQELRNYEHYMTLMAFKYRIWVVQNCWVKKQETVHFTVQQHAISRPLQYIKLRVVQNNSALQYMHGFAKTHNYINAQCTDISSTMYHNKWLTYIMGLWMLVTTGQEMFLQIMFVSERFSAHITAICTLPCVYTLMTL